jgi:hypothetical protein
VTIQVLELRLTDILAGDYIAWCVDPEPVALGRGLRAVTLDAEPLGQTVTATLEWDGPAPSPVSAARTAGLPAQGTVRERRGDVRPLIPRSSRADVRGGSVAATAA